MIEGFLDGTGLHVGIAVASWNQTITDAMLEAATGKCQQLGVPQVTVLRVPGALELPIAAAELARSGADAVVAIGAIVKGETDHYDIVARESAAGLSRVALDTGVPVANAILAVHDYAHAVSRSGPYGSNKGSEAAEAAVLIATALRSLASG